MKNDILYIKNNPNGVVEDRKFRSIVQYDRKVPQFFDFGKLSKHENSATYAILGELKDRYNPNGVVFSYRDIAYMSGYVKKDTDGKVYARTGARFNKFIEELQKKLQGVAYSKFISVKRGQEVYSVFPLFKQFQVNHAAQELTIFLSDELIQEEIVDEFGNILQPRLRVSDLFNNPDWSTTQYLKFSRKLHNSLSVDAQNLYRFLSEYRYLGRASMNASVFEEKIMHFFTTYDKRNKNSILKKAVKELQELTYDGKNKIFEDLVYTVEKRGNKITNYHFRFKTFSIDLNYVDNVREGVVSFEDTRDIRFLNIQLNQIDKEVLSKFHDVFSKQPHHDNDHNRKQLKSYTDSMGKEVVLEALDRTAMDSRRGVGWFLKLLRNWDKEGVQSIKDIDIAEAKIFNKPSKAEESNTNIPEWSDKNPNKQKTKTKVLSDKAKSIIQQQQQLLFKQMKATDEESLADIHKRQEKLQDELNQLIESGSYYQ